MLKKNTSLGRTHLALSLFLILIIVAQVLSAKDERPTRIVTIGGAVTEIAYALGQQDRLIARDTTSTFPQNTLPDIGYMRALSPEGVLSVSPDLIVAIEGAGPPETMAVLRSASVNIIEIPENYSSAGIAAKIRAVGVALGVASAAGELARDIETGIETAIADARKSSDGNKLRVMFILSTQNGRITASGTGTAADSIISMAGGINAVTAFKGYKPLTDEAVTLAAPDVILMMNRGGHTSADNDELFAMPALVTTPAAQNQNVVRMNGMHLLGFGPRTATAIVELSKALYGTAN